MDNGTLEFFKGALERLLEARLPAAAPDAGWRDLARRQVMEAGGDFTDLAAASLLDAALGGNVQGMKLLLGLVAPEEPAARDSGVMDELEREMRLCGDDEPGDA